MTAVGGNLENKPIGLQFGVSGTFVDCELVDGKVQLKSISQDSSGNNIYANSGTWTSEIIDIGDNFNAYGKLFASEVKQGDSSIKLETRTSSDGNNFEEWQEVSSDGTINSTKNKFIQVKVTFYVGYGDLNFYISQGNNADDAKNVFNNDFIDTSNGITLKRDYEFNMTKDTSWNSEGELHRKLITRNEWSRIDKMNVLRVVK